MAQSYFNGQVDEITLWSAARDAVDVAADMNRLLSYYSPYAPTKAGSTAYWSYPIVPLAYKSTSATEHGLIGGAGAASLVDHFRLNSAKGYERGRQRHRDDRVERARQVGHGEHAAEVGSFDGAYLQRIQRDGGNDAVHCAAVLI